jgi:hypothetical protein
MMLAERAAICAIICAAAGCIHYARVQGSGRARRRDGAGSRLRTDDLPLTRRLLYQLSYSGSEIFVQEVPALIQATPRAGCRCVSIKSLSYQLVSAPHRDCRRTVRSPAHQGNPAVLKQNARRGGESGATERAFREPVIARKIKRFSEPHVHLFVQQPSRTAHYRGVLRVFHKLEGKP